MSKFFEDIAIGERIELGSFLFTADDIVRYAREYDPQRFHLSEEEAAKTHFGRLCASGWHTACVYMKLMVAYRGSADALMRQRGERVARLGGSPGFRELRWLKPVYAGDRIAYAHTVTDKRSSASRPEWGIIQFLNEGRNQNGDMVFDFKGTAFVERRGRDR
jgi:acyl dehydratase